MNRRLNPDLFGPQNNHSESLESASYSAVATRKLETEVKESKKRISHLESLNEVLQNQISTMNQQNERRNEVFSKALSQLEKDFREESLVQKRRIEHFNERFRDQKMKDEQMESIIERYNTSLVQFENRLAVLQRVISEKEMTLTTYRRIIEQIVDEVEKLKKRVYSTPAPRQTTY